MREMIKAKAIELLENGTVDRVLGWKAGEFFYDLTPGIFKSREEILCGRILRLTAGDNGIDAELTEQIGNAVTGCNSNRTEVLLYTRLLCLRCFLFIGNGLAVLYVHVLDLQREELTVLTAECEHLFRGERMDMELDDRICLEADDRITDRLQEIDDDSRIECVNIDLGVLQLNQKLGAVAVGHFAVGTER